ncbi:MCM domain-containing protein 2 [Phthorimaea operculella]|nr:MCM domain-containing protein 2 [Phthorimaea operculella]
MPSNFEREQQSYHGSTSGCKSETEKCIFVDGSPKPAQLHRAIGVSRFASLLFEAGELRVPHSVVLPEECEGNEVVLHYIPKVPPKCYVCRSLLFENSGLRRCGEKVAAIFKLKKSLLSKSFTVVDDLISKLKHGSIYNIYASAIKKSINVLSLEEVIPLSAPITTPIPADIGDLFKVCKGIPWQFIYCLASSIGASVCPLHHYMHLKICLLMSLASIKANVQTGSTILHVLVAGYDTGYVGQLMEKGAELADRAVFIGTTNTGASDALVASSGGVCVLPLPLHTYKQKLTSAVLSSIETGEVVTDNAKVKLRSAVWAQGMDFKKMTILNVASVFGTVCRGDYGEYNDEIIDFLLQNAVDPPETNKEEAQALKDVADYIDLVAGIDVSLNGKAEQLLRNYFLAARRERPRGVTVVSMGALVATSLTSARLCRRQVASVDDAVLAVWLHVCGSPEPRFAPEEYLQTPADVKTLHKMMDNFKDWLEQFTGSYIS